MSRRIAHAHASLLWLALVVLPLGCASRRAPYDLGPLSPVVEAYSRNGIVCAPTVVGNFAGVVAGLPPGAITGLTLAFVDPELGDAVGGAIIASFVYAGGAALGTPFLPLAYFAPEDPCMFEMR